MKRVICCSLSLIIIISIPTSIFAMKVDEDYSSNDHSDDSCFVESDYDLEQLQNEANEPSTEFGYTCYEPITDPQLWNYDENVDDSNNIQLFSISNQYEDNDMFLDVDGYSYQESIDDLDSEDMKNIISSSDAYDLFSNEYSSDRKIVLEGSCNDGENIYFVFLLTETINNKTITIDKAVLCYNVDNNDNFVLKCARVQNKLRDDNSEKMKMICHGNDITFNSLTNQLVFECGTNDDAQSLTSNRVAIANASFFRGDSDNLSMSQKNVSCKFSSIDYNEQLNRYVVNVTGAQNMLCILDCSFNIIAVINNDVTDENALMQGIYSDENYIYSVYKLRSTKEKPSKVEYDKRNVIAIHNWKGKLIKEVYLNIPSFNMNGSRNGYEIEGVTMMNDKVYANFNYFFTLPSGVTSLKYVCCDLSKYFFNIKYCKDSNVDAYKTDDSLDYTNIMYGILTSVKKNSFIKEGYAFSGWNLYKQETDQWMYTDPETNQYYWYREGDDPSNYVKRVCNDKAALQYTAPGGGHLLLCATWQLTDKFYISFNSNNGTETMNDLSVVYGTATKTPDNVFTKQKDVFDGTKKTCINETFMGWNIYNEETEKWLYTLPDGTTRYWYKEGTQPVGSKKTTYGNGTTISATAKKGQHIIFYALWNEFVVYFDSYGAVCDKNHILKPLYVIYGVNESIKNYKAKWSNLEGFLQFRLDDRKWKFVNKTNSRDYIWDTTNNYDSTKYKYYCFTGDNISKSCYIGGRITFRAKYK